MLSLLNQYYLFQLKAKEEQRPIGQSTTAMHHTFWCRHFSYCCNCIVVSDLKSDHNIVIELS